MFFSLIIGGYGGMFNLFKSVVTYDGFNMYMEYLIDNNSVIINITNTSTSFGYIVHSEKLDL